MTRTAAGCSRRVASKNDGVQVDTLGFALDSNEGSPLPIMLGPLVGTTLGKLLAVPLEVVLGILFGLQLCCSNLPLRIYVGTRPDFYFNRSKVFLNQMHRTMRYTSCSSHNH